MGEPLPEIDVVFSDDLTRRSEGCRLHAFREEGDGLLQLADERVLPERVDRADAHRILSTTRIWLTQSEQRWLLDVLQRALATTEEPSDGD